MASSTTPTRRTRAGWTASGACTSGSTARHSAATRPATGGAATMSTTASDGKPGHANQDDDREQPNCWRTAGEREPHPPASVEECTVGSNCRGQGRPDSGVADERPYIRSRTHTAGRHPAGPDAAGRARQRDGHGRPGTVKPQGDKLADGPVPVLRYPRRRTAQGLGSAVPRRNLADEPPTEDTSWTAATAASGGSYPPSE